MYIRITRECGLILVLFNIYITGRLPARLPHDSGVVGKVEDEFELRAALVLVQFDDRLRDGVLKERLNHRVGRVVQRVLTDVVVERLPRRQVSPARVHNDTMAHT